jgi:cell division protein FtsW (lipid II flippase)
MQINNFNSYFEIFVGLNIAYTGIEGFRWGIEKILEDLRLSLRLLEVTPKKSLLEVNYETEKDKHKQITDQLSRFFLVNALFCVFVLLLSGWEETSHIHVWNISLSGVELLVSVCVLVLVKREAFEYKPKVKSLESWFSIWRVVFKLVEIVLIIFVMFLILNFASNICGYTIKEINVLAAILIAVIGYFLHILRVVNYRNSLKVVQNDINKVQEELKASSDNKFK